MPTAPARPCTYPGCGRLTFNTRCDQHKRTEAKQHDQARGSAHARGYTPAWQRYRATYLRNNPLCITCTRDGKVVVATVIDHIRPHKGDQMLFWDKANHQPLCEPCHNRKTATEDGGFGNRGRG